MLAAGIAFIVGLAAVYAFRPVQPSPRISGSKQITSDGFQKLSGASDGNRIYLTESSGPRIFLAQVSSSGGEVAPINVPIDNAYIADVSRDGSELLVSLAVDPTGAGNPFWSVPVPAGSPRRLGSLIGNNPVWAPNGQLVFAKGKDMWQSTMGLPQESCLLPKGPQPSLLRGLRFRRMELF